MRYRLLCLISFFACPMLAAAQPPSGSIALYTMNNTAADISGNGYNGTLTSTTAGPNRFAKASAATVFTAGSSTGTLPGALQTAIQGDFTLGYWFKTTMTGPAATNWYNGAAMVDAEVCGQTNDWGTALVNGGAVAFGIGNPDLTLISATSGYNNGAWHFVTGTRSMTGSVITLYVDGTQVGTLSGTNTTPLTAPSFIGLGKNDCVATGVFTGSLDDMIFYSRVLTSTEVTSLYTYYAATTLPLHWTSFSGQLDAGQVDLRWQVDNSVNNDHFEIDRSTNGKDFSSIGTVADQAGTPLGAGSAAYAFTDRSPSAGTDYYRLKQVDIDGNYSWSTIISITIGKAANTLRLQANPVTDEAVVVNDGLLPVQRIQVLDASGRVLIDQAPASANSLLAVNTSMLRSGYYLLRIVTTNDHRPTILSFVKL